MTYGEINEARQLPVKLCTLDGGPVKSDVAVQSPDAWIVGTEMARVTLGDKVFILAENQSAYMLVGDTTAKKIPVLFRWKLWTVSRIERHQSPAPAAISILATASRPAAFAQWRGV